jgi:hypothetical protein
MMSSNDPWLNWIWDVNSASGAGASYVKPANAIGHFALQASVDPDTQEACYVVSSDGRVMPPCWSEPGLRFFARGKALPSNVANVPLPDWSSDPEVEKKWQGAEDSVRSQLKNGIQHLEGLIYPKSNTERLFLFRVDAATVSKAPLLAIHLDPKAGFSLFQDGTAHGGGHT